MQIVVEMCYCQCGSIEYECMRSCTHNPMQDSFMSAHAHVTAQHALDAQSHAPVITANANKPLCLLHMHHYSKCTGTYKRTKE